MQKIDKKVCRQTLGKRVKIEASRSHTCNVAGDADKNRSMEKLRNEDNKERT